jgi:hypothetical protein
MKQFDLNIKFDDLGLDEKDNTKERVTEIVLQRIEQAIVSSYAPESGQNQKPISSDEQRKINRIMTELESHKNGIVQMKDTSFALLINKWNERRLQPMIGPVRKLFDRIDRIICADEFTEQEK